jgi:hypothetical protein
LLLKKDNEGDIFKLSFGVQNVNQELLFLIKWLLVIDKKKPKLKITHISTIRSDRLLGYQRSILDAEKHEVFLADNYILNPDCFFTFLRDVLVNMVKHFADQSIVAEYQSLQTHCSSKL